ncbi:uncharacterized protein LOC143445828 [Clavelina lepadiformis]|uniref:uncharacterized protein LOC143445828 n=1 Tax=Clavelina lepadiformis TaxID=159417 RepID=UPI00404272C1
MIEADKMSYKHNENIGLLESQGFSKQMIGAQAFLFSVLIVFGFLLNGCIIWLVYQKRSLQTITNMWVVSLCLSQVFACTFSLPFALAAALGEEWIFIGVFCQVYGYCTLVLRTVSIISLSGIALDRYNVISRPFCRRVQKNKARWIITATWCAAAVGCIPPLTGIGSFAYSSNTHMCQMDWTVKGMGLFFAAFYITSVYVQTIISTFWSYILIYKVTTAQADKYKKSVSRSQSNSHMTGRILSGSSQGQLNVIKHNSSSRHGLTFLFTSPNSIFTLKTQSETRNVDHKANQTIVMVLSVFLLTWSPYFAFALYGTTVTHSGTTSSLATQWCEFIATWLSFSTCIWDPLLYGAYTHNFKEHFRDIFRCKQSFKRETTINRTNLKTSTSHFATNHASTHRLGVQPCRTKRDCETNQSTEEAVVANVEVVSAHVEEVYERDDFESHNNINSLLNIKKSYTLSLRRGHGKYQDHTDTLTSAENASFVIDDEDIPTELMLTCSRQRSLQLLNGEHKSFDCLQENERFQTKGSSNANLYTSLPTNSRKERDKRRAKLLSRYDKTKMEMSANDNDFYSLSCTSMNVNTISSTEKCNPPIERQKDLPLSPTVSSIGFGQGHSSETMRFSYESEMKSWNSQTVTTRQAQQKKNDPLKEIFEASDFHESTA